MKVRCIFPREVQGNGERIYARGERKEPIDEPMSICDWEQSCNRNELL